MSNEMIDPSTEMGKRRAAEMRMQTQLRKVSDAIGTRTKTTDEQELDNQWFIAQEMMKVKEDPDTYQKEGVNLLAELHGFDATTLRNYTNVAEYVEEGIYERAKKHNKTEAGRYGRITFTHLVQLSRLVESSDQTEMLDEIVADGMSTVQLRARIDERIKYAKVESTSSVRRSVKPTGVIDNMVKQCTKLAEGTSAMCEPEFETAVIEIARKASETKLSEFNHQVAQAMEVLENQRQVIDNRYRTLSALKQKFDTAVQQRLARENGIGIVEEQEALFNESDVDLDGIDMTAVDEVLGTNE